MQFCQKDFYVCISDGVSEQKRHTRQALQAVRGVGLPLGERVPHSAAHEGPRGRDIRIYCAPDVAADTPRRRRITDGMADFLMVGAVEYSSARLCC